MSAHADDLRYQSAEDLNRTIQVTATAATSVPVAERLEPGRYMLRIVDFAGATAVWVRQGRFGEVTAAAAAPSTRFSGHTDVGFLNLPLLTFHVRAGDRDGMAFFSVGGNAIVQITKISRDRA